MKARNEPENPDPGALKARLAETEARLAEAEETLRAIYEGEVDGLVVNSPEGDQIFTLKGAETPYRLLLEAMNEGALTLSLDGTILYCNSRFAELARRPMEQAIGAAWKQFFPSGQHAAFQKLLKEAKRTGTKAEFTLLTGNGPGVPVEVSVRSFKLDQTDGFSVLVTDITERKLSEQALREANEKLELRVAERTRELTTANETLQRQSEELASANEEMQAQSEELQAQSEELQAQSEQLAGANQQLTTLNEQLTAANQRLKTANEQLQAQSEELATVNEELHAHAEQVQAANKDLADARTRLETILDQMPAGVVIGEAPTGKLVLGNAAVARIFRQPFIPAASIQEYGAYKSFHPDGRRMGNHEHPMSRAVLSGEVITEEEVHILRGDGTKGILSVNAAPIRDAQGRIIAGVVVLLDITERNKMELDLQAAQAQLQAHADGLARQVAERTAHLEATNKALETVCYNIAHDLRAPNRTMQGFADLLLKDYAPALDASGQDYLRRIAAAAKRSDQLILDLLAYARLGHTPLPCGAQSLEAGLQAVLEQLDSDIQSKQAKIEVRRPLPVVQANRTALLQVLGNLLNNALKFVAPGVRPEVTVWAEEVSVAESQGPITAPAVDQPRSTSHEPVTGHQSPITNHQPMVRLWVRDNGIGVAPEHHGRLFNVFERVPTAQGYPGTGMGLAIVQKAIERMGGRVGLESAAGQGSRFWIELPKAEPAAA